MLQKIFKFFNVQVSFENDEELERKAPQAPPAQPSTLKLDNGMDTLAAVSRYINLKDSPYILIKGEEEYEYVLQNAENGSVIMRFKSMLKEYNNLSR